MGIVVQTTRVTISKRAQKDIQKVPRYIADKLDEWIESVETDGIVETRKIPGYHDEPLKGHRLGQRSIRLNKAYRAVYVTGNSNEVECVTIEEVNKHDY